MNYELYKYKAWVAVLKEVEREYRGHTIDHIIRNLQQIISFYEKEGNNEIL